MQAITRAGPRGARGMTTVEFALLLGIIACASIALWGGIGDSAGACADATCDGFDQMADVSMAPPPGPVETNGPQVTPPDDGGGGPEPPRRRARRPWRHWWR
jgi:Flp pilus assembly pilin Flp